MGTVIFKMLYPHFGQITVLFDVVLQRTECNLNLTLLSRCIFSLFNDIVSVSDDMKCRMGSEFGRLCKLRNLTGRHSRPYEGKRSIPTFA